MSRRTTIRCIRFSCVTSKPRTVRPRRSTTRKARSKRRPRGAAVRASRASGRPRSRSGRGRPGPPARPHPSACPPAAAAGAGAPGGRRGGCPPGRRRRRRARGRPRSRRGGRPRSCQYGGGVHGHRTIPDAHGGYPHIGGAAAGRARPTEALRQKSDTSVWVLCYNSDSAVHVLDPPELAMHHARRRPTADLPEGHASPRARLLLLLLCVAQLMVILDISRGERRAARPGAGTSASRAADIGWTITSYSLIFGSLLLLGGRAADLLGRRRVFLTGLGVFTRRVARLRARRRRRRRCSPPAPARASAPRCSRRPRCRSS